MLRIYIQNFGMGLIPDVVTDQTPCHEPLHGYIPNGFTVESAKYFRNHAPQGLFTKIL